MEEQEHKGSKEQDRLVIDVTLDPYVAPEESSINQLITPASPSCFPIFKRISRLAIPMTLSFTFSFEVFLSVKLLLLLSETDTESAAAGLVSILMNTSPSLFMAPIYAISYYLNDRMGQLKQLEEFAEAETEPLKELISSANANGLLIATISSIPAFFTLFFSEDLLTGFGQDPDVSEYAQDFLRPYSFAMPALFVRLLFEQIMFSFGEKHIRAAMWMALATFLVGFILSLIFGFGLGVAPMGSFGIALGFLIESYLTVFVFGLYVAFNKELRPFNFFKEMRKKIKNNLTQLTELIIKGLSIFFITAIELSSILAIGLISGLISVAAQAAMSHIMQFIYFENIALMAFSFTCAQEIMKKRGGGSFEHAGAIAKYGLLTTFIYLAPLPTLFAIFPQLLERISGDVDEGISDQLTTLTPIMSFATILYIVYVNIFNQLRTFKDDLVANTIATIGMCGGIVLSAYLGLHTSLDIDGVATGYAIGVGVTACGFLLRWKNQIPPAQIEKVARGDESAMPPSLKSLYRFFKTRARGNSPLLEENSRRYHSASPAAAILAPSPISI